MTSAVANSFPAWFNTSFGAKLMAGGVGVLLAELVSIVALRQLAGSKAITEKTCSNWTCAITFIGGFATFGLTGMGIGISVRVAVYAASCSNLISALSAVAALLFVAPTTIGQVCLLNYLTKSSNG